MMPIQNQHLMEQELGSMEDMVVNCGLATYQPAILGFGRKLMERLGDNYINRFSPASSEYIGVILDAVIPVRSIRLGFLF